MANFDDYFALYNKGSYREALAVLRDIIESEPRWSEVGDLYVMCAHLELLVNDDVHRARQLLDKASELGCSDMVNYYRVHGYVLWIIGERESGMQEIEKSIELEPRVSNLTTLGRILSFIDDKRALGVWQKVLEKDQNDCLAHICIGMELAKSGDRGKALLMAKRAEKLNPSVKNVFEIGQLYEDLEQFQSALNAYLEANRCCYEPKGTLYVAIAACCYSLGDDEKAVEYAIEAIELNCNEDYVKNVLLSYSEKEGAPSILDRIIKKCRDTCLTFIILAQKALKKKDFFKARELISKAKQLEPTPVEMYYIGRLYVSLGHFERALNVYSECEKLGYAYKGTLYASIAGCYCCMEDWSAAIQYASRALELDFNDDYSKDVLLWSTDQEGVGPVLDKMVEEHRDTCLVFILLAQKAFRSKDFSEARDMVYKAEQLEPSPTELYNIARLYYDLGHLEKSLHACLRSERLGYSSKDRLYISIAGSYYCLHNYDKAIQYAIKALNICPDDEYTKDILYTCRKEVWGSDFGDNY